MSEAKRPRCPVCGRLFWCDYPNKWVYKRDRVFLCSWGCMRKWDVEGKEAKQMKTLTKDEKQKAVQIALDGGNPLQYLKELGCANPTTSWKTIRNWARGIYDQDKYEKLPESFGKKKEEPKVELVYDESIAEEYRREQAQKAANEAGAETVKEEDERDNWQVAAVRNKKMGTFYYDEKFRTIDWRHPTGEEISLPPEDWKWLGDHIRMILHAMGVE